MDSTSGGTVTVNNTTTYSDPFKLNGTFGMTMMVAAGQTAAVTVVLQGGWEKAGPWLDDPNFQAQNVNDNNLHRLGTTDTAIWPFYRLRITSTGQASVNWRIRQAS